MTDMERPAPTEAVSDDSAEFIMPEGILYTYINKQRKIVVTMNEDQARIICGPDMDAAAPEKVERDLAIMRTTAEKMAAEKPELFIKTIKAGQAYLGQLAARAAAVVVEKE